MNKQEILDFLELPESTSDQEIKVRLDEKLAYFQLLSENAPNDFLRKLHINNTQKVKDIQAQLRNASVETRQSLQQPVANNHQPVSAPVHFSAGNTHANRMAAQQNKEAVAWLVRHTENQSAKTFPLYYGKNFIGRNNYPGVPTIVISEDPYISRTHTMLDVTSTDPLQIIVSDGAVALGGKPSKNGTYLNGNERRIQRKEIMEENDTIQIGMTKFLVKANKTSINKIVQEVEESEYMKTVVIDIF